MFTRSDWSLFRNLTTLGQKAGVPRDRLARLVMKELVDNALDAGGEVKAGHLSGKILREAKIDEQVKTKYDETTLIDGRRLRDAVGKALDIEPANLWTMPIDIEAENQAMSVVPDETPNKKRSK